MPQAPTSTKPLALNDEIDAFLATHEAPKAPTTGGGLDAEIDTFLAGLEEPARLAAPAQVASHPRRPVLTLRGVTDPASVRVTRQEPLARAPEPRIGPVPPRGPLGLRDFFRSLVAKEEGRTVLSPKGEAMIPFAGPITAGLDAYDVVRAARRVRDGKGTAADELLLEQYAERDAEAQKRGTTWWYDVANVAAQLPGFAAEFALTGGAFTGTRKIVQEAVERVVKKKLAGKVAGYTAGSAAQAAAMPHRIAAGTLERQAPKAEDVYSSFRDWEDDFVPALARAVPDHAVEIFSERTGGLVEGPVKALAKLPIGRRVAALKTAVMNRWLKLHPNLTIADFMDRVKSATAWNGIIGEVFEERVGELMRASLPEAMRDEEARKAALVRIMTGPDRGKALADFGYQLSTEAAAFAMPGAARGAIEMAKRPREDGVRARDIAPVGRALRHTLRQPPQASPRPLAGQAGRPASPTAQAEGAASLGRPGVSRSKADLDAEIDRFITQVEPEKPKEAGRTGTVYGHEGGLTFVPEHISGMTDADVHAVLNAVEKRDFGALRALDEDLLRRSGASEASISRARSARSHPGLLMYVAGTRLNRNLLAEWPSREWAEAPSATPTRPEAGAGAVQEQVPTSVPEAPTPEAAVRPSVPRMEAPPVVSESPEEAALRELTGRLRAKARSQPPPEHGKVVPFPQREASGTTESPGAPPTLEQETGPPEGIAEREALIERIVAAARKPQPEIVAINELKGTDGNWHNPHGFPLGVQSTGERRTVGYAFRSPDGITYGTRQPTPDALMESWRAGQLARDEEFRSALREMDTERLQSQARYWLKEAAPEPTPAPSAQAAPEVAETAGATVTYNRERGSLEVKFPAKPPASVIGELKRAGFRWAVSNHVWYHKRPQQLVVGGGTFSEIVERALARARQIVGLPEAPAGTGAPEVPRVQKPARGTPTAPTARPGELRVGQQVRWLEGNQEYRGTIRSFDDDNPNTVYVFTLDQGEVVVEREDLRPLEDAEDAVSVTAAPAIAAASADALTAAAQALTEAAEAITQAVSPLTQGTPEPTVVPEQEKERGHEPAARTEDNLAGGRPAGARDTGEPATGIRAAGVEGVAPAEPRPPEVLPEGRPGEAPAGPERGPAGGVQQLGAGARPPRRRPERVRGTGEGRPKSVDTADSAGDPDVAAAHAKGEAPRHFVIQGTEHLTAGGWATKLEDNLAALRLLKKLQAEARMATGEEQDVLARYIGWGHTNLAPVVDPRGVQGERDPRIHAARTELEHLLTAAELKELGESTVNAHYSFYELPKAMWALTERLGFHGGIFLDPACGNGHFEGTMPPAIVAAKRTRLFLVDKEPIAAAIAQQLYQDAYVQTSPFEKANIPDGYFDLAMTNVPFGRIPVFDPAFLKGDRALMSRSLHNYYFAKALDVVRPGGLVIFVTSRYTMDSRDDTVRTYLAGRADFLGAFRLPREAFERTAGTEVVTDVVVLRRREEGGRPAHVAPWLEAVEREDLGKNWGQRGEAQYDWTNQYFKDHPERVLGKESRAGSMYAGRGQEYTVEASTKAGLTPEELERVVALFPENIYKPTSKVPVRRIVQKPSADVKQGAYTIEKGKLYVYDKGTLVPSSLKGVQMKRAMAYVPLRDAYQTTLNVLTRRGSDEELAAAQRALAVAYERFVREHGYVNERANRAAIIDDPNSPRILALEHCQWTRPSKGRPRQLEVIGRADIFTKRPIAPPIEPTHAESPEDALAQSLAWRGSVDLPYMVGLTGRTQQELAEALEGQVFEDPAAKLWLPADEYLSGDVVTRLAQAKAAADQEPRFRKNVEALEKVQPKPLEVDQFKVPFGATYIPPSLIKAFLEAQLGRTDANISVRLLNAESKTRWYVTSPFYTHEFLPEHAEFAEWVENALNNSLPQITRIVQDEHGKEHEAVDGERTEQYRQSLAQLRERWAEWWPEQPEASTKLTDIYNAIFNREAERQFDVSSLILPNMSPEIILRPWQKRAVVRGVRGNNNLLLAHDMGTGKTYSMSGIAMEWRRLGLTNKPAIVVPNNLVEQWRRAFLTLFPTAKVLVPTDDDYSMTERRRFAARVANNDWDAVIIAHSHFLRISVKPEVVQNFIGEQERLLLAEGASQMNMDVQAFGDLVTGYGAGEKQARNALSSRNAPRTVKDIVRAILRLRARLQKRLDQQRRDAPLTWEELGFDGLLVDEAHLFKNLYFPTSRSGIAGLSSSDADRAMDMYLKVRLVNEASKSRRVVFGTGTPLTNAMSEVYTVFRYLAQGSLDRMGMPGFDGWSFSYAIAEAANEPAPGGGYKERTRLRNWNNLRELSTAFRRFADVVTEDDVVKSGVLRLPKVKNGRATVIALDPDPQMVEFMAELRERIEALKSGKVDPKDDNHLLITTQASAAAIDMRLVNPSASPFENGRIAEAARQIAARWHGSADRKGTQLVFLDIGVPIGREIEPLPDSVLRASKGSLPARPTVEELVEGAKGAEAGEDLVDLERDGEAALDEIRRVVAPRNLYGELKRRLVAEGVPADEIVFQQQAQSPDDMLRLYDAMNDGRVRVMVTTRAKGGVGMNVQRRGIAVHHIDVPWRPDQLAQADKRFVRDGNENEEVEIVRYVTKGSFDEYRWGVLAEKNRSFAAFMTGSAEAMEDVDPTQLDLQLAAALASGDPRSLQVLEKERQLRGLRARVVNAQRRRQTAQRAIDSAERLIKATEARLPRLRKALTEAKKWAEAPTITLTHQAGRWGGLLEERETPITYDWADTESRKAFVGEFNRLMEQVAGREYGEDSHTVATAGPFEIDIHVMAGEWDNKAQRYDRRPFPLVRLKGETTGDAGKEWTPDDVPDYRRVLDALLRPSRIQADITYEADSLTRTRDALARNTEIVSKPVEGSERIKTLEQEITDLRAEITASAAPAPGEEPEKAGAPSGTASVGLYSETEPGRTGTRPTSAIRPVEFPELVQLARELASTPQVIKRFRGEKRGEFRPMPPGTIRLAADLFKEGNEQQLAATLAHEVGHLVDWLPPYTLKRGNLLGRLMTLRSFLKHTFTAEDGTTIKLEPIRAELQAVSNKWRPWDPKKVSASFAAYRRSSKELYADAISVLLRNPGMLEEEAPVFYNAFFEALDRKPEVKRAYFDLQDFLAGTPEELIARRRTGVREMFEEGDYKAIELQRRRQQERVARLDDIWTRLKIQMLDKNFPLIDRVKALEKRGVRISPDDDPRYALEERNYLGGKLNAFTLRHFGPIYKGLLAQDIDWTTFGEALFYDRIIAGDRSELANPRGISPDVARQLAEDLRATLRPEQRPTLEAAITAFRAAVQQVADEAHEVGLYGDEMHAEMKANPAYVTFRVIEHLEDNVTSRVYRQIGTLKDIANPADATMLKTLATIRAIEQQKVKLATFEFLEKHYPEDIEQANEVWTGKGRRAVEPKDREHQVLVPYYENGRVRGKYVGPYIADSINNTSVGGNLAVISALRWANSGIFRPVYTTFNLGFQTFNFGRDFLRFWKNVPGMTFRQAALRYFEAVPLARYRAFGEPRAIKPRWERVREELLQAQESGILGVTFNDFAIGRHVEDTLVEDTLARMGVGGFGPQAKSRIARYAGPILGAIKSLGDFIETLPKAAAMYEFRGEGAIADIPPDQRSFIRRKVGSPDFLAGGTWKPVTNEALLFSNAISQAIRSDLEVATEPKTRAEFWWKTAKVNIVPKFLIFGVLAGLAAVGGDDGDEEDWRVRLRRLFGGISEYDLTNYIPIPLGLDAQGNSVYLRLPQDDFGRLIGGLVWKALSLGRGNTDALKTVMQVFDYTAGQMPSISPAIQAGGDIASVAAGRNVYDPFRSRFLFTDDELAAMDARTFRKFLGYEFQQLGGGIVWKFYPGEQRPRNQPVGQRILNLPVVSNIVGRWIKVSDYGETERLRRTQAWVARSEARTRLSERAAVNAAIREYQRLPREQQNPVAVHRLAVEAVNKVYADAQPEVKLDQLRDVTKKIWMGVVRGEGDPVVDAVMSARSNAQKVAILIEASRTMPEFRKWLTRAVQQDVISPAVYAATQRQLMGNAAGR